MHRRTVLAGIGAAAAVAATPRSMLAAESPPVTVKQVAPDLYFFFDYTGSNSVFLTTNDGVLVIDTRQHPRAGAELIAEIRKISGAPIRWVVNSHFHGDHTFGNAAFEKEGATFVAQAATPPIMAKVHPKEMARRQDYFRSHNYDPAEVKLILPSETFTTGMTISLGKVEARLIYLGTGQQDGDTFVYFPHARALFTPGSFATRNIPNMAFTTSVHSWLTLLDRVVAMSDVDRILPAHGDLATRADVQEFAQFLRYEYTTVKDAIARGMPLEQAQATLTFPQYRDWRNYPRVKDEIANLYELIQTGRRSYFDP